MCFRKVQCTRYACGHDTPNAESLVDCGSTRCRYSKEHRGGCKTCSTSCKQWLRPAQTVVSFLSPLNCIHCRR
ncbi:hypothetical protein K443DRAFT_128967 [Laccaria amethystina LaAM-08-1]|uniref:Uncharacterized protein n=1 Tax=Laccaria amethystina LaAM-08-1 TaxID=1095629 RepID=A0A0C9X5X7_9AGAR|nr:hypothetical protein K443DRAFT_128967 [Laccaria amethystina LaAM-08-1]